MTRPDSAMAGASTLPDVSTLTVQLQAYLGVVRSELCGPTGETQPGVEVDIEAFFARYSSMLDPKIVRHFLTGCGLLQELPNGAWRVRPMMTVQESQVERVLADGGLPTVDPPAMVQTASEPTGELAWLRMQNARLRDEVARLRLMNSGLLRTLAELNTTALDE